jgi:hypothetical protein
MQDEHDDDVSPDDLHPELEENTPSTSIFDAFQPEPVKYTMGKDGFPLEHDPPGNPGVPSLTPENLTCLAQDDGTPKCSWFARQLVPTSIADGRKYMRRLCTHQAFKTLSGAGMEISDSAVYACEMRDPPHGPSIADLDRRDARSMARAKIKHNWRMFRTEDEAKAGVHTLGDSQYERENTRDTEPADQAPGPDLNGEDQQSGQGHQGA